MGIASLATLRRALSLSKGCGVPARVQRVEASGYTDLTPLATPVVYLAYGQTEGATARFTFIWAVAFRLQGPGAARNTDGLFDLIRYAIQSAIAAGLDSGQGQLWAVDSPGLLVVSFSCSAAFAHHTTNEHG